jgi:hypothetical protein
MYNERKTDAWPTKKRGFRKSFVNDFHATDAVY